MNSLMIIGAFKHLGEKRRNTGSAGRTIMHALCKIIYYLLRWTWTNRLVSCIAALLLLASITLTSFVATGNWLPITATDSVGQSIQENAQLSPDIKSWLLALRSGDIGTMLAVQNSMNPATRAPDSALYVLEFSEPRAQVKWTAITVTNMSMAADGMIDTYVEVDMTPTANSQGTETVALWHFTTMPDGSIFLLDYVSARTS
jgi:hypothetical protein